MAYTSAFDLLSNHVLSHRTTKCVDLLCLLTEGARRTEKVQEAVGHCRSFDVFLLTDFSAHHCSANDVDYWNERQQAVKDAGVAYRLGNSAGCVTRHEVSDDADSTVVEATKQAVLKLTGHLS